MLSIHVPIIALSYASFALALGLGSELVIASVIGLDLLFMGVATARYQGWFTARMRIDHQLK